MGSINTGKVVVGGLAAGLVMNVVLFLVHGVWLADQWMAESTALNIGLAAESIQMNGQIGWTIVTFLHGLLITWVYAAIRPRFGPGAGTAIKAALVAFLIAESMSAAMWFTGLYSMGMMLKAAIGGLVAFVLGGLVGGKLYSE